MQNVNESAENNWREEAESELGSVDGLVHGLCGLCSPAVDKIPSAEKGRTWLRTCCTVVPSGPRPSKACLVLFPFFSWTRHPVKSDRLDRLALNHLQSHSLKTLPFS